MIEKAIPPEHIPHLFLTVNDHDVEYYEGFGNQWARRISEKAELIIVPPDPHIYDSDKVTIQEIADDKSVKERELGRRRILVTHGFYAPRDFMAKNSSFEWTLGDKDSTKVVDFVNAYNQGPGKDNPIEVLYICDCPEQFNQNEGFSTPIIHGAGSEVSGSITRFSDGRIETILRLAQPEEGHWVGLESPND
ncbi:MAG TPA: hypothetical protein VF209_01745 [Patescibacteria group bacterium]